MRLLLLTAAALATLPACSTSQPAPGGTSFGGGLSGGGGFGGGGLGGGNAQMGDGGAVAPPPPTSCQQTLDCMFSCPMGDMPCQNACYALGSTSGNALLLAFAQCVEDESCNDADCIVDFCSDSLLACAGASRPESVGTPLPGAAPPGSVPADLVGLWSGARNGDTTKLTLGADGSGVWETIGTTSYYACSTSSGVTRTGTIVVGAKTMTLSATSVTRYERVCTPGSTTEQLPPETYVMHWSRHATDPNIIFLVDEACAAKYPGQENCEYAGCPIGMWCTSRLTKQ